MASPGTGILLANFEEKKPSNVTGAPECRVGGIQAGSCSGKRLLSTRSGVAEKEWNEQGAIVRDFLLKKEDPLFEILEKSRELDKKKQ